MISRVPKLVPPVIKLNLDFWSKIFFLAGAILTASQAGLLVWTSGKLPTLVPLFYSLPWGEARLVDPNWLWTLPILSAVVLVLNLIGSHLSSTNVLTRILSSTAFVVTALAFITLGKILLLEQP